MTMRLITALILSGGVLAACQPGEKADPIEAVTPPKETARVLPEPSEDDIAAARAASKMLGSQLKAQLVAAMQAEGPIGGVEVCAQVADDIAQIVSEESGMSVGRTALRTRNKANDPDEWEREGLEQLRQTLAEVEGVEDLEYFEVVERDGEVVFRWMAPIMMGDVCQACHGTNVSDEVKAVIAEHYPDDAATGFMPGELRGAFTVEKVLAD